MRTFNHSLRRRIAILMAIALLPITAFATQVPPGYVAYHTFPEDAASPKLMRTGSSSVENQINNGVASLMSDTIMNSSDSNLLGYNEIKVLVDTLYNVGDVTEIDSPYPDIKQFKQTLYITTNDLINLLEQYRASGILPTKSTFVSAWGDLINQLTGGLINLDEFADSPMEAIVALAKSGLGNAVDALNMLLRGGLDLSDRFKQMALEVTENTANGSGQTADETYNKLVALLMSRWMAPGGMFDVYNMLFALDSNGFRALGGTQYIAMEQNYENTSANDSSIEFIRKIQMDYVEEQVAALQAYTVGMVTGTDPHQNPDFEGCTIEQVNASSIQEALSKIEGMTNSQAFTMGLADKGQDLGLRLPKEGDILPESTLTDLDSQAGAYTLYKVTTPDGKFYYQLYIPDSDKRTAIQKTVNDELTISEDLVSKLKQAAADAANPHPFINSSNNIVLRFGLKEGYNQVYDKFDNDNAGSDSGHFATKWSDTCRIIKKTFSEGDYGCGRTLDDLYNESDKTIKGSCDLEHVGLFMNSTLTVALAYTMDPDRPEIMVRANEHNSRQFAGIDEYMDNNDYVRYAFFAEPLKISDDPKMEYIESTLADRINKGEIKGETYIDADGNLRVQEVDMGDEATRAEVFDVYGKALNVEIGDGYWETDSHGNFSRAAVCLNEWQVYDTTILSHWDSRVGQFYYEEDNAFRDAQEITLVNAGVDIDKIAAINGANNRIAERFSMWSVDAKVYATPVSIVVRKKVSDTVRVA